MKITKTISIAGRLDICSFATLARSYEDEGMRMRSKSDILWQAVEQLSAAYCEKRGEEPFTDVREAIEYMESIGIPLVTNMRALRETTSAKIYQDAGDDYGVDVLYEQAEATARRKEVKRRLNKRGGISIDSDRARYEEAVRAGRELGMEPISFEEFIENDRRKQEAITETINEIDYKEKEERRRQAEKDAASPSALISALNAISKTGEPEG